MMYYDHLFFIPQRVGGTDGEEINTKNNLFSSSRKTQLLKSDV